MEITLTPEQEARLVQVAEGVGKTPTEFVLGAIALHLESDQYARERIRRGIEQADSGEFIEEEEMDIRLERMLRS